MTFARRMFLSERMQAPAKLLILQFVALLCASGTEAKNYYVNPSGANGAFKRVQGAVDAVTGATELNRANIFIAPGTYSELLTISKPWISLIGTGDSPAAVNISFASTQTHDPFDWGAVVEVQSSASAFMARNLTFQNTTPDRDLIQALALESSADRAIFDEVEVLGFQDTLLVDNSSRQYFLDSGISGDTDFIFGDATAVFDGCTIQSTDFGWVTASNTQRSTANGLIFLDCSLVSGSDQQQIGGDGSSPDSGSVYLGRPWQWNVPGIMPSVIYIRTRMGNQIARAGWDPWNGTGTGDRDPATRLSEFGSMDLNGNPLIDSDGNGTPDGRVPWNDPMSEAQAANYTLENIFGPADFWNSLTQPETGDQPYTSQGAPWNAQGQLALLPSSGGDPSRALNLSTRAQVKSGDDVTIAGFIVNGTKPVRVLLRGLGGSLRAAGITDALADPNLDLRKADGELLQSDDNWQDVQASEINATGIAPTDPHEAAMIVTLAPGSYSAVLSSRNSATGVGLVELYDLDGDSSTQLVNVSTRGLVGSKDDVMIAGFILGNTGPTKVLLRGLGPSLASAGIVGPLSDPTLTLYNSDGSLISFNDNWSDTQQSEIAATGIAPENAAEAAIVTTLPAGAYTVVLAGNGAPTGVALVEIYTLE